MRYLSKTECGPCDQKMGSLPEERVTPSVPFTHIGIDFAGPLHVKEGTSVKKTYICVFTCASSRMVHLELTNSLTTESFYKPLVAGQDAEVCAIQCGQTMQKLSKQQVVKLKKLFSNRKNGR